MQRDQHNREQIQTQQIPASFQCNLCLRSFSTNHGKNVHLSSYRKRSLLVESTSRVQPIQQDLAQVNVNITARSQPTSIKPETWGVFTEDDIHNKINVIYEEIVYWGRNLFKLPSGAAGKKFISEATKWIEFWIQDAIEFKDIALKVLVVMPALLLQKPTFKSTAKEYSQCLSRRLAQSELGKFDELLREASTVQAKLPTNPKGLNEDRLAKIFAKLVLEGKKNAAMKLLDQQSNNFAPPIPKHYKRAETETPRDKRNRSFTVNRWPTSIFGPCYVSKYNGLYYIANAALRTRCSCGPSGLDADGWRRILVSKNFGAAGYNLRGALATFAQKISTIETEVLVENGRTYTNLETYTACRLIPLDNNPSVRPIGVGEVLRRIVRKAILSVIKPEIMSSARNYNPVPVKQVDVRALYMLGVTSSRKSPLTHCSWWMQTIPVTRLTEASSFS